MKIYFIGSISGKEKYLENYQKIVGTLESQGHTVIENTLKPSQEYVYDEITDDEKVKYYKQVLKWINKADVVVAEASHSSLSVGHEISVALEKSKPVVVLYTEGNAPHFLEGITSDRLIIENYNMNNLASVLNASVDYASDQQDTRFNFFISPKIANYLDWISKSKRLPRAVYLRNLIEDHMTDNQEYQENG